MKSLGLFKKALWENGCGVSRLSSGLCGGMIAKNCGRGRENEEHYISAPS